MSVFILKLCKLISKSNRFSNTHVSSGLTKSFGIGIGLFPVTFHFFRSFKSDRTILAQIGKNTLDSTTIKERPDPN